MECGELPFVPFNFNFGSHPYFVLYDYLNKPKRKKKKGEKKKKSQLRQILSWKNVDIVNYDL